MRIEELEKYQRRNQNGYFDGLPADLVPCAQQKLDRFIRKRRASGKPLSPWLFAIYCGQAKRLARNPPTSAWGRSMLAKRGGHAVQRKYRCEGRHPTAKATRVRVARQAGKEEPPNGSAPSLPSSGPGAPFASVTVSQGRVIQWPGRQFRHEP